MNAYEILGVSEKATEEEVKIAYKELSLKCRAGSQGVSLVKDEYNVKMQEINQAFDEVIQKLKTGAMGQTTGLGYDKIQQLINDGYADEALEELNGMGVLANDAVWNFLMGSAYYAKGWATQATGYIEAACRLDPKNKEYMGVLNKIRNNAQGNMHGAPYGNANPYRGGNTASGCSPCDICTAFVCADVCCDCC